MQDLSDKIMKGGQIIKNGGVVAFPTETVYGLGANAYDDNACKSIYKLKERPSNNPLIVHVLSLQHAKELAIFSDIAKIFTNTFWPGPLTMILPKREDTKIAASVTAGLDTIAIRVPAHPAFRKLLELSECPIAAPSANKSGYLSPTKHQHVQDAFKNDNLFIIPCDDKKAQYGIESTIVDMSTDQVKILRYGFITQDDIEKTLNCNVMHNNIKYNDSNIKAPGMLYKHYSPKTPIRINATNVHSNEAVLNFGDSNLYAQHALNLSPNGDLLIAASNLYDYLHKLDNLAQKNVLSYIAVARVPNIGVGVAINDRLNRAANHM